MSHALLNALLISHIYHSLSYSNAYYYSRPALFHAPTTAYYTSAAYSSRYGAPTVQNGRVVHSPAAAVGTPVARGTPISRATPVAVGRPVGAGASSAPVAAARPVATATSSRPSFGSSFNRPTTASRGWSTARTAHRSSRGFSCFAADAPVRRPDGRTTPIVALRPGDEVAGWASAADALSGKPPRALRVSAVQHVAAGPPLHGLALRRSGGERIKLAPFVTANHPLLGADGRWLAMDVHYAQAELDAYVPNATVWRGAPVHRPKLSALRSGERMLRSAAAGGAVAESVVVESVVEGDADAAGPVYSLELEVAGFAVYIVNGMLAMD